MPKTWGELHDSYAAHVDLLDKAISFLPQQEAVEAARGIVRNVRSFFAVRRARFGSELPLPLPAEKR